MHMVTYAWEFAAVGLPSMLFRWKHTGDHRRCNSVIHTATPVHTWYRSFFQFRVTGERNVVQFGCQNSHEEADLELFRHLNFEDRP